MNERKVWILKAKGDQAAFGGNLGYADQPTSHYVYDTNVKNCDKLAEGDLVIIADKEHIIGYASVSYIEVRTNVPKVRLRCPECNTQEHYIRKKIQPKYQCRNKHTFDIPVSESIVVTEYIAHYATTFVRPSMQTSVKILEPYYLKRNYYYSIQQASPNFFNIEHPDLEKHFGADQSNLQAYEAYIPSDIDERDYKTTSKAIRKGQSKFKSLLIEIYGLRCMITGCEVLTAIEASHICPYRGKKDHHPFNGLLLRTDLHQLFDANLIGIEPNALTIELHPSIVGSYYQELNGRKLQTGWKGRSPSFAALEYRWGQFKAQFK
jgi:putative restriction endonuclease